MRLALAFREPKVDRFVASLTPTELAEWMAFEAVEPLLPERVDIAAARQMALVCEMNRDRKARTEPFSPQEFVPIWETPPERTARLADEQRRFIEAQQQVAAMDKLMEARRGNG